MIVRRIFFGTREVTKILRAGKIIWPEPTETELSVILAIFSAGYHAMQIGETIVLTSSESVVSAIDVNAEALQSVRFYAESHSKTFLDGSVLPADGIICFCDTASMTHGEVNALVTCAVSFTDQTDILTDDESHQLVAGAVYGDHTEDNWTDSNVLAIVADVVYGDHAADFSTMPEVAAEVPTAVSGAFTEDNGNTDDAALDDTPDAVFVASQSDSRSDSNVTMMPFRVDGVVEMDADAESRTEETSQISTLETAPMASMLRFVTTCEAHLLVPSVADMKSRVDSKTTATIFLHFEGEEPGERWYEPVQTGSNLYIRSAWLFWNDGGKGHIDTDVWYEVIREGSNLYIRSVDSSWQDAEKTYIDLSVFYEPKQKDNNLYIRSADSVWTDGGSANIDTEFFLAPVQEGSNLYIRQDIFGGA